jgi:histidinol-phosphatase (PHP family)
MPFLFDLHVHTVNSPDASLSEDELAQRAAAEGLSGVGFVAHLDLNPDDACHGFFQGERYTDAVRKADREHPEITVLCGVEVGEPHLYGRRSSEMMRGGGYDFVTGALHWVDDLLVLDPEPFRGENPLRLAERYYRTTLEMLAKPGFDVLAHMGIFRRGMAMAGFDTSLDETVLWPGLLQDVLGRLIETGVILEVNTSGLRRREHITYPTPRVLDLYRSMGGRLVTLGSDTHGDPWVFYGLSEGLQLLLELGFDRCHYIRRGEPCSYAVGDGAGACGADGSPGYLSLV